MFEKTDDHKTEAQAKELQPVALSEDELDAVAGGRTGGYGRASYQYANETTYS